ncbi:DEAD/DEAH box helicase [Lactococcus insecticola]|uniref:Protein translocase subunit SecA n=1 Tax=Pseudolactococcus insecticola TaxID=2709158 RepID=A0A6A0BAA8_9LACT|nr:DEAD/DEAH box helicase [Lactococcus insecticola]GFH41388.1 protein translocase subunit SecA 1 [Lactococcus insecticola]
MFLKDKYDQFTERKVLKQYKKLVEKIRHYENNYKQLSDKEFQKIAFQLKKDANGNFDYIHDEDKIAKSFSVASEAVFRIENKRPYDSQLIGGLALAYGHIAEMKTGEGKTLTAILPTYLMALLGYGSHVITVNEYLAQRDRDEVAKVFEFLGMSVGLSISTTPKDEKKIAYESDVTYTTNSEVGFDLLRDNTTISIENKVLRKEGLYFGIVDEFDQVLVDDSKTPLISAISSEKDQSIYQQTDTFIKTLNNEDYEFDELMNQIRFSDAGAEKANKYFKVDNVYSDKNYVLSNALTQSLQANYTMQKNKDYIVEGTEILIVDISTGRALEGRRLQSGLHQAIEAKEGVPIQAPTITTATITYKNLFKEYKVLTGMTGTVHSIKDTIEETYEKQIIRIPVNKKNKRIDLTPIITTNQSEKIQTIVDLVIEINKTAQPILIGTPTVTESIILSRKFDNLKIKHNLLNAIDNAEEEKIIARAGKFGQITIATNMAARGTDIKISEEVEKIGGLFVVATTFFDNQRIDDQLKGRAARQGQKGTSIVIASLEDDLYKTHGNEGYIQKLKNKNYKLTKVFDSWNNQIRIWHTYELQKISESKMESSRKKDDDIEDNINDGSKFIYDLHKQIAKFNSYAELFQFETDEIDRINEVNYISKKEIQTAPSNSASIDMSLIKNPDLVLFTNQSKRSVYDNLVILAKLEEDIQLNDLETSTENLTEFESQKQMISKTINKVWQEKLEQLLLLKDAVNLRSYAQVVPKDEFLKEFLLVMDTCLLEIFTKSNYKLQIALNSYAANVTQSNRIIKTEVKTSKRINRKIHIL